MSYAPKLPITGTLGTGTTTALSSDVTADTQRRLTMDASGKLAWGSGSAVADATLERGGTRQLLLTGKLQITSGNSADVVALVKGAASQSGNYIEVRNSGNTLIFSIDSNGSIVGTSDISTTGRFKPNGGSGPFLFGTGGALQIENGGAATILTITSTGQIKTVAANEATGAGSAALGSNSPAATPTAPYTWLKFTSSDGSQVYVPAWK